MEKNSEGAKYLYRIMEKKAIRATIYIFVKKDVDCKKVENGQKFWNVYGAGKVSSIFGASPLMDQFYDFFVDAINEIWAFVKDLRTVV